MKRFFYVVGVLLFLAALGFVLYQIYFDTDRISALIEELEVERQSDFKKVEDQLEELSVNVSSLVEGIGVLEKQGGKLSGRIGVLKRELKKTSNPVVADQLKSEIITAQSTKIEVLVKMVEMWKLVAQTKDKQITLWVQKFDRLSLDYRKLKGIAKRKGRKWIALGVHGGFSPTSGAFVVSLGINLNLRRL
jgi:hypothetical protein